MIRQAATPRRIAAGVCAARTGKSGRQIRRASPSGTPSVKGRVPDR